MQKTEKGNNSAQSVEIHDGFDAAFNILKSTTTLVALLCEATFSMDSSSGTTLGRMNRSYLLRGIMPKRITNGPNACRNPDVELYRIEVGTDATSASQAITCMSTSPSQYISAKGMRK